MKIFDCFLFFNELEILELRLMTLNDTVDYFVLVEANRTFTGNEKDFIFEKNSGRYQDFLDKIIYVKVEDARALDKSDIWAIESFQRNCIERGLLAAREEDRVIISDVDEIPNPKILMKVKNSKDPVTFRQYLFYYYVNCISSRGWNGSIISSFENMGTPQRLRTLARKGFNSIKNGGWHYSYMGGLERIKSKLNNLSDAHTRIQQVGTDQDILRKMTSQKDLWDENLTHQLIDIDQNNYSPKCIKTFLKKYPNFHFNQN